MKTSSADAHFSYTNAEIDLQFSRQLVRSQVEMSAKRLALAQRARIDEAVAEAAAEGAKGLKITWSAPRIELLK